MNAVTKPAALEPEIMEMVLADGDLSRLTTEQRLSYYARVCETQGLNPLTRPFDYIKLNGKLVLYAKRECTDQKRKLDGVSIEVVDRRVEDDVFIVTARATNAQGRTDEDFGAVSITGLRGEARANAMLKAVTKAKRRVTLSICGMGMLDESEVEGIQQQEREVQSTVLRDTAKALPRPVQPRSKLDPVAAEMNGRINRMSTKELDTATNGDEPRPVASDDPPWVEDRKPADKVQAGVDALIARYRACTTKDELVDITGEPQVEKQKQWLAKHRPELAEMIAEVEGDKYNELVAAELDSATVEEPA